MTPSLRDAQVAKLIEENERLRLAVQCASDCLDHNPKVKVQYMSLYKLMQRALAEEQGE